MAGLFSRPKTSPPPVPPPPAIPEVQPEAEEFAGRLVRRRKGFRRSILTGEMVPRAGRKASLLGGLESSLGRASGR